MSIPLKAHQVAQQFCQRQPDASKAKQIYLNTLAVYSVHDYLTYLNIPTSLSTSDSWDSSLQYLMDVADLDIPNYGRLECRPVLPDQNSCYVPPDVWSDRVGYLAVQFDAELTEATVLGFLPAIQASAMEDTSEYIPLSDWQSLATFIQTLPQVSARPVDESIPLQTQVQQALTHLSQWLEGVIASEWQGIEHAFASSELSPSFRNHAATDSPPNPPSLNTPEAVKIIRCKRLHWDSEPDGIPLILILGLAPTVTPEIDIWVQIKPQAAHTYLPLDLSLMIVDEHQQPVIQTQSRGTEGIQLKFGGYPNERFSVKVVQGQREIIETFMV